ncbi:peroxiredoxin [Inquilinus ginsengisoli]|uniref:peroxiredoxin-like family protein n=1 Tax=Inquilinus ginsengisoli TaxID=363840 RepID=UPI003D252CA6
MLNDPEGRPVSSADLLRKGPLVVSFYRGVWCPYCNMELQALEAAKPEFEKLGATLVAISPQTAPNSGKSMRQNSLTFPILSDAKGAVGAAFGLRFQLPGYLVELYKGLKNDLPVFSDDPSWTLPMPARYVIAQDRTILYAEVNPDYTRRPESGGHAAGLASGLCEPRRLTFCFRRRRQLRKCRIDRPGHLGPGGLRRSSAQACQAQSSAQFHARGHDTKVLKLSGSWERKGN